MMYTTIYINKFLTIVESNQINNQIEHFYYLKNLPDVYRTTNVVEAMILSSYYSNIKLDINRTIPLLNFSYFDVYKDVTKHCHGVIGVAHILKDCYESINVEKFDSMEDTMEFYNFMYSIEPKIVEVVNKEYNKISSNIKYGIKYSELLDILNSNPFFVLDNHIAFNIIDEIVEKERKENIKND